MNQRKKIKKETKAAYGSTLDIDNQLIGLFFLFFNHCWNVMSAFHHFILQRLIDYKLQSYHFNILTEI